MEIQATGVQSTPKQFTNAQKAGIAAGAVLSAGALASVPMAFYKGKSVSGEEKFLKTLIFVTKINI